MGFLEISSCWDLLHPCSHVHVDFFLRMITFNADSLISCLIVSVSCVHSELEFLDYLAQGSLYHLLNQLSYILIFSQNCLSTLEEYHESRLCRPFISGHSAIALSPCYSTYISHWERHFSTLGFILVRDNEVTALTLQSISAWEHIILYKSINKILRILELCPRNHCEIISTNRIWI